MPKTSSSQIYDHIKFCISTSCLSRKVRQKSRLMNFIYDVLNVALGIRVAHLVDVTFLTYEETLTFISSLRQVNVPNSLIYLLNTQIYSTFIKENEKINSILFISQIPQCIISFTGWILEYQVIYILEKNSFEFESQNIIINCLGNQELKLYRIFLKKIDNNNNHNSDKERHMLLSFSCPVKIFNSLNDSQSNKDIISTVLNDTFTFRIEHNQSFWNKGWELEISDVCLPVVAL
ncbi:hypothetical protein RhiirA1_540785 [Rhizophagus irregularis]|uniref:Uncharacterized protein n=1 Tax=Rhizophagus irregularis TaxID=588596 RepID=A0A2N0R6M5_9GLOM|nr:hypothetical protein RhiirA1_540785 [Rhizophagus irregularis]